MQALRFAYSASVGLPHASLRQSARLGTLKRYTVHASFSSPSRLPWFTHTTAFRALAGVGLGLGMLAVTSPTVLCESISRPASPPPPAPTAPTSASTPPPADPPKSILNVYELTFGSVCGICAGVFVKKGVKLAAFLLGGIFVVLQYLGHMSVVRVDWNALSSRFENLFYRTDAQGARKAPTVGSLFTWFVDFLTANFQERATFVAGFILGLRIG